MKKKIKGLNKHKENKIVFVICKVCQTITLRGSLEMLINRGREREEKRIDLQMLHMQLRVSSESDILANFDTRS